MVLNFYKVVLNKIIILEKYLIYLVIKLKKILQNLIVNLKIMLKLVNKNKQEIKKNVNADFLHLSQSIIQLIILFMYLVFKCNIIKVIIIHTSH
jgi:hypothetical protein